MKKVLIIEDEEILLELLQQRLSREKYEVFAAKDGEEGLKLLKKTCPDLVLLDIILPKLDGFEIMKEKNKDPELKKIPVIVISNSGQPLDIVKMQKLGAKDWLIKTEFDPQEVVDKVKKQIY